ncbi:NAD(P)/FAD-dependent oxidoreductase [Okibacterium endophyticum]
MTDVAIVGSGPNGLAAAVTLARAGLAVDVFEAAQTLGGGARTLELTEPGFLHDWGSAVQPMAYASPFFAQFGLSRRVEFSIPDVSYGHAFDDGAAGIAWHDLDRTVEGLGTDGPAWRRLLAPLVHRSGTVAEFVMNPMLPIPRHPVTAFRYATRVLELGTALGSARFRGETAPAMLAGVLAHAVGRVPSLGTAAPGVMLALLAHSVGWPIPVGGSQSIVNSMVDDIREHGGRVHTGRTISSLADLPDSRAVIFDTTPRQLVSIAGDRLSNRYRRALMRFRHGNGLAKVDFALSEPVPWRNADLRLAGTVHMGGVRSEIAAAEAAVARGGHAESPYVLAAQPSLFDSSRAPIGRHTLWAYTHVPHGSERDMTEPITAQIERFAPGFRDVVMASASMTAADLERQNPNFVGGDISGGAVSIRQLIARPVLSSHPWRTPARGLYLCSASTPPGPGVHGMGGFHAARLALEDVFDLPVPSLSPGQ